MCSSLPPYETGLGQMSRYSLFVMIFYAPLRDGLRIDWLVSLVMSISLPPSRGLRLDVKLVSLYHVSFLAA